MQASIVQTPRKKKKWIIIGIITLIVAIAAINIVVMQKKKVSGADFMTFQKIEERTMSSTKLVSGRVTPASVETIYVDAAKGEIKEIFVEQGNDVAAGQKLFSYENPELDLQIQQAELQQKTTAIQYDQGKEKVRSLKKEIEAAKSEQAGNDVLAPLQSQLEEQELQQKTTELTIEQNKLQKQQLEDKRADLVVYSKINGRVQILDKDAIQGSAAGQAKVFIQLASNEPFRVEGTLTELQKAQVQPDQPVTVTSKAVANKTWSGKIIEVSEYPTDNAGADAGEMGQASQKISHYKFKAVLDTQEDLSPGYHVALEIELSSNQMMAAPRSSIVEEGEEKFLYVVTDGKLQKQLVKTGMSDGEWIEITEGVTVGQEVLENPSEKVHDGMEVRAQ